MLTYRHPVMGIAIVEHTEGNDGGGMLPVSQDTYLRGSLHQGPVELVPGTARQ